MESHTSSCTKAAKRTTVCLGPFPFELLSWVFGSSLDCAGCAADSAESALKLQQLGFNTKTGLGIEARRSTSGILQLIGKGMSVFVTRAPSSTESGSASDGDSETEVEMKGLAVLAANRDADEDLLRLHRALGTFVSRLSA